MFQQASTNNAIFVTPMKNIQSIILNFIKNSDDNEENYQIIIDYLENQKIRENINKTKSVLILL